MQHATRARCLPAQTNPHITPTHRRPTYTSVAVSSTPVNPAPVATRSAHKVAACARGRVPCTLLGRLPLRARPPSTRQPRRQEPCSDAVTSHGLGPGFNRAISRHILRNHGQQAAAVRRCRLNDGCASWVPLGPRQRARRGARRRASILRQPRDHVALHRGQLRAQVPHGAV